MKRLKDKIAVITAAASGIGRANAERLAGEGATVVALDINPAVADIAAALPATEGQSHGSRVLNCTQRQAVEQTFASLYAEFGRIDILVNGVGINSPKPTEFYDSDPDCWDLVIEAALKATMLCTRQVAGKMREAGAGKIVNIGSASWLAPTPTFADYNAGKAGIVGFTRVLAVELAPFGVNVNAVAPGPILTPLFQQHSRETQARVIATIPLGHLGEPHDIASAVAFLVSDDARFITGHNLVVAGGRAMV